MQPLRLALSTFVLATALSAPALLAQPRLQQPAPQQPAQPAPESQFINGVSPEQTVEVLKAAGYEDVSIYTTQAGAKHATGKTQGVVVSVIHTGCNNGLCSAVLFHTQFGKQDAVDAKYMDAWHREKLYGQLYTSRGNLIFGWSVHLVDTSLSYLRRCAIIYSVALKDLQVFKPAQQQ